MRSSTKRFRSTRSARTGWSPGPALRAGEITRRVRDLIRKEVPHREPADLNEVVSAALAIVASAARDHAATLRFRQGAFLPAVAVDRIQIEQVVMNLLLNALDAVERGDGVREIEVYTRTNGEDAVEVAVCDSGVGIDPAKARQLTRRRAVAASFLPPLANDEAG